MSTHPRTGGTPPADSNVATATPSVVPVDFKLPLRAASDNNGNGHDGGDEEEYLVDVEIHTSFVVKALTPETAAAKAVLYTIESDDESVVEVGRDVHTCVHAGLDSDSECDHEEREE